MGKPKNIGMRKLTVTVPTAGVPVAINLTPNSFPTDFELYVPLTNVGDNMYIGDETVDNGWIPRPKGTPWNFVHGTGNYLGPAGVLGFDLAAIFINADVDGDQVIIQYYHGQTR